MLFWGFGRFLPQLSADCNKWGLRPHLSQSAESCGRKPPKTPKKHLKLYLLSSMKYSFKKHPFSFLLPLKSVESTGNWLVTTKAQKWIGCLEMRRRWLQCTGSMLLQCPPLAPASCCRVWGWPLWVGRRPIGWGPCKRHARQRGRAHRREEKAASEK